MPPIEQAGAIVVSDRDGQPSFLLVTAKRNPAHWIFPKGHIEPGESLETTALREAEEEAGITGTIVRRAGTLEVVFEGETLMVHYFVVRTNDEGRPEEGRRMKWCSYDEALTALSFENTRALLRSVWPV